jgi:RND family efflux transporter MFP subunit
MATTLREELASLKIERQDSRRSAGTSNSTTQYRRSGGGLRVLSWLLWMIPLGILGVAGAAAYRQYEQIRSKPEVTVGLVERMTTGQSEKLLTAKGYLISQHQSMIGTKVAGRVEEIRFKERDQVKAGQVLAIIEHHDLLAMIEQRKANMERAKAELEESKADQWEKDREARRAERLVAKKMVPQEDYEKAASLKKMSVARVAALEASIKVMKANLDEMEYTRKYQMHLVAPFEGTVLKKEADVGEIVNPMAMSSSLGRSAVATIADLMRMDVETDVNEDQMWKIKLGQPAEVSVTVNPTKRYRGRLRQIIPLGDRTRSTVKVKVEILDPDDRLFPELAAQVHFLPFKTGPQAETSKAYLFVKKSAVFQENGHDFVWVVDRKKSQVNKRQVEVATTNGELARVESGLKFEENVVMDPPPTLRNNEVVRISE